MSAYISVSRGPEGTIYETEKGFDDNPSINIDPAKVRFIVELKRSEASSIFPVNYDQNPRVLKIFHNNADLGYADDKVHDLNQAHCEIQAYCRLKQYGICDMGYVPQFYGYTLSLDPAAYTPHLDAFLRDTNFPSAILIEYLPNPLPMNCVTYTKEQMETAVNGIKQGSFCID
ncbi:hypothetical protein FQN55_001585 [Onygenales sp. PD_40]|nr:hypothetical protein FQN55_001585 [Onygenales sp. PD_40]